MGKISVSLVKLAPWERALPERLEVGGTVRAGELELPWKPSEGSYQGCLFFLPLDVVLGEVKRME